MKGICSTDPMWVWAKSDDFDVETAYESSVDSLSLLSMCNGCDCLSRFHKIVGSVNENGVLRFNDLNVNYEISH